MSERGIGLCFLANTLVIVVAQLPVAKWLEGRRRMAAYGVEGTIWAAAWLIVFAGGWWFSGSAATAVFALALTVFGFGECFHGTVQNALITDLARPGLVGRYLALNGFAFQLGGAGGRAIGGFALATAPHGLWLVAAAVALGGGAFALLSSGSSRAASPDAHRGRDMSRWRRAFDPQLPREVWLLQLGGVMNSFGNGVVLPFLVIYLHDVRGFGLGLSGLVVSVSAAAQLSAGILAGPLVDRLGARRSSPPGWSCRRSESASSRSSASRGTRSS